MEATDQGHRRVTAMSASRCRTGLWSSTAEVAYYVGNSPISARMRHRNPMPLARREQPALHPRCHVPGGSVPYPYNPGVSQATLLATTSCVQSDFNVNQDATRALGVTHLSGPSWEPLVGNEGAGILMAPLFLLSGDMEIEDAADEDELLAEASDMIPTCIAGIHEFWRNYRKPLFPRGRGRSAGGRRRLH